MYPCSVLIDKILINNFFIQICWLPLISFYNLQFLCASIVHILKGFSFGDQFKLIPFSPNFNYFLIMEHNFNCYMLFVF